MAAQIEVLTVGGVLRINRDFVHRVGVKQTDVDLGGRLVGEVGEFDDIRLQGSKVDRSSELSDIALITAAGFDHTRGRLNGLSDMKLIDMQSDVAKSHLLSDEPKAFKTLIHVTEKVSKDLKSERAVKPKDFEESIWAIAALAQCYRIDSGVSTQLKGFRNRWKYRRSVMQKALEKNGELTISGIAQAAKENWKHEFDLWFINEKRISI